MEEVQGAIIRMRSGIKTTPHGRKTQAQAQRSRRQRLWLFHGCICNLYDLACGCSSMQPSATPLHDMLLGKQMLDSLASHWNVDKAALKAAAKDIDDHYDVSAVAMMPKTEQQALLLLHVKGANPLDDDPAEQRRTAMRVLAARERTATNSINHARFTRLLRLVERPEDKKSDSVPPDVETFEAFCVAVPSWKPCADVKVFFRDVVPGCLVQRVQLSGLCYMHGSDVVLHYAACKTAHHAAAAGGTLSLTTMVDLNAFILRHFTGEKLCKYVYSDDGGNSQAFLAHLAGRQVSSLLKLDGDAMLDADAVEARLEAHGPALVSMFDVFDGFGDASLHVGEEGASMTGRGHAMAIVGWRREKTGGALRLLVQNWWKTRQFLECDLAFLRSREAALAWLVHPVTIPTQWPVSTQVFAETSLRECLDRCLEIERCDA